MFGLRMNQIICHKCDDHADILWQMIPDERKAQWKDFELIKKIKRKQDPESLKKLLKNILVFMLIWLINIYQIQEGIYKEDILKKRITVFMML